MKPPSAWTIQKQARRAQRERELAAEIAATNAFRFEKIYGVIHADDLSRAALPAARNCVLFLWSTPPMLLEAMSALNRWGFTYKSNFAWLNYRRPELVLIGSKGHVPAPAPGTQYPSVFEAEDGRAWFGEMIARMFPSTPCLDLLSSPSDQVVRPFGGQKADTPRWGNETPIAVEGASWRT